MLSRDVEKLESLGYQVVMVPITQHDRYGGSHRLQKIDETRGVVRNLSESERDIVYQPEAYGKISEKEAWKKAKTHAQSPEGMKVTMSDKVKWLIEHGPLWSSVTVGTEFGSDGPTGYFVAERIAVENGIERAKGSESGLTPEAALDALFWKVP